MKQHTPLEIIAMLYGEPAGLTVGEIAARTGEEVDDILKLLNMLESSLIYFPLQILNEPEIFGSDEEEEDWLQQDCAAEMADRVREQDNPDPEGDLTPEHDPDRDLRLKCIYSVFPQGRQPYPQLNYTLDELMALQEVLQQASAFPGKREIAEKLMRLLWQSFSRPPHSHVFKGLAALAPDESLQKTRQAVEGALVDSCRLQVFYSSNRSTPPVRYSICPLGLVCDRGTGFWYLLGTRKLHVKPLNPLFLRLDRILELIRLTPFKYPSDFNLHAYMKPFWGMQPGKPVPVKVRFYNEAQVVFKARRELAYRCPPGTLAEEPDGSLLYTGEVVGIDVFRAWLRSFGSSVQVLEPPQLREKMLNTARQLYQMHAGPAEDM